MGKLSNQIQFLNDFSSFFGLRPAGLRPGKIRAVLFVYDIAIIAVLCTLVVLQVIGGGYKNIFNEEGEVTRLVHMISNVIIVILIVFTSSGVRQLSLIQKKLTLFDKYCFLAKEPNVLNYILFPLMSFTVYLSMDAAKYSVFHVSMTSVDVIPTISENCFEFFNVLYSVQFSMHLLWLKRMTMVVNAELDRLEVAIRVNPSGGSYLSIHQCKTRKRFLDDCTGKIRFCRSLHHESMQLHEEITNVFASRNVLMLSFNFVICIIILYPVISETIAILATKMSPIANENPVTAYHLFLHCKWSIIGLLNMYALISASQMTASEFKDVIVRVHRILSSPVHSALKSELRMFAIQIWKREMECSPFGLLTLNNKLFLSIVATFITYMIVIIQLQM